ncbi:MAG: hypothetical protein M3360_01080 [Actinomycetota bacterium]|nr:hypothetical protein [Actinomycetota bacterium]
MKRLAVLIAAEETVAAYHDLLEHPGPEAELRFQDCIALLSLRLAILQRHGRGRGTDPAPIPVRVGAPWGEAAPGHLDDHSLGAQLNVVQAGWQR